jgi:hypothetical protein
MSSLCRSPLERHSECAHEQHAELKVIVPSCISLPAFAFILSCQRAAEVFVVLGPRSIAGKGLIRYLKGMSGVKLQ